MLKPQQTIHHLFHGALEALLKDKLQIFNNPLRELRRGHTDLLVPDALRNALLGTALDHLKDLFHDLLLIKVDDLLLVCRNTILGKNQ